MESVFSHEQWACVGTPEFHSECSDGLQWLSMVTSPTKLGLQLGTVNSPLLMKPKNTVQHTAHSSLLLKPKGSWSSTAVTGRPTFGWMPLVTRRIRGEVVGVRSSSWICKCLMAAMCIFIVDTDTVCARWAVHMMSVHSFSGSGGTLSWLENFWNDLWGG